MSNATLSLSYRSEYGNSGVGWGIQQVNVGASNDYVTKVWFTPNETMANASIELRLSLTQQSVTTGCKAYFSTANIANPVDVNRNPSNGVTPTNTSSGWLSSGTIYFTFNSLGTLTSGTTYYIYLYNSGSCKIYQAAIAATVTYSKQYVVTLNKQNSSHVTKTITVTEGGTYSGLSSISNPTKTGYTFKGWYTASSGGSKITSTTKVNLTSDQTLYAQYTANTITVNYYSNFATSAYSAALNPVDIDSNVLIGQWTATADDRFPDNLNNYCEIGNSGTSMRLDKIGYHGTGNWIVGDPSGSMKVGQDDNFENYTAMCNRLGVDSSKTVTAVNVYAEWEPNAYKLHFNANGGVNCPNGNFTYDNPNTADPDALYDEDESWVTVTYDSNDFSDMNLNIPTRNGYKFLGWYTMNKDTETYLTQVYDKDGRFVEDGTYWKASSQDENTTIGKWSYTDNLVLYAKWEALAVIYSKTGELFIRGTPYVKLPNNTLKRAVAIYVKDDNEWKMGTV